MSLPLISVIIPTFNRAYCIARSIDSALAQSHANVEVLVVDDGSSDGTGELLASRYCAEPRLRYLFQRNDGVSAARNAGIAASQGEFVAFLDSDDFWYPWKLELQLQALRALPEVGMIWTDMEAIDANGAVRDRRYLRRMYDAYRWFEPESLFTNSRTLDSVSPSLAEANRGAKLYYGDIFSRMVMGNLVHTSTTLLRRERLERVGLFDQDLRPCGEDYDFHLRTCREGPVAFIDVASIRYQCGLADRVTRPALRIHFATSFLKTITGVIARDRDRIALSPGMISAVLAEAHAWIGEEAVTCGDHSLARRHLTESLRHDLWQPRAMCMLGLAWLPHKHASGLRRAYRRLKQAVLHSAAQSFANP